MRVTAAILAAGTGTRFGADKTLRALGGKPVWRWSFDAFAAHPAVQEVILVCSPGNLDAVAAEIAAPHRVLLLTEGDRQASARLAASEAEGEVLLIHDAARPFVTAPLIDRVLAQIRSGSGAAPATPVVDTIRNLEAAVVERDQLRSMQTPQGAPTEWLRSALQLPGPFTDDLAALQAAGYPVMLVEGEPSNFKITYPEDWLRAEALTRQTMETRTGLGYDIHAFSQDPSRKLVLGGVEFEGIGLEGHSDADALTHAVVDAILGAAALGDIGQHFPNTDERWRGKDSQHFLRHAAALVREQGYTIVNLDATVVAERPKVMKRAEEVRATLAESAGLTMDRVSLKATTNERLGSIGREEGIAAFAVATLTRVAP